MLHDDTNKAQFQHLYLSKPRAVLSHVISWLFPSSKLFLVEASLNHISKTRAVLSHMIGWLLPTFDVATNLKILSSRSFSKPHDWLAASNL
jgi:hypothetical protein